MNHLDLNKKYVRENVISKLRAMGYDIDKNTDIRTIRTIIKKIQIENKEIADGHIGSATMKLLKYDVIEFAKLMDISNRNYAADIVCAVLLVAFGVFLLMLKPC